MSVQNIKTEAFVDLLKKGSDNLEIIDVREPDEFNVIRVKGSKSIPLKKISSRLNEVDWNKDVIFLCRSGARSLIASEEAVVAGKNVKNLEGGINGILSFGKNEILEI